MKYFLSTLLLVAVGILSACSDESASDQASDQASDNDGSDTIASQKEKSNEKRNEKTTEKTKAESKLVRSSPMADLVEGLKSDNAETRAFCAAVIGARVRNTGVKTDTDLLIERMNDPHEQLDTRWACASLTYTITKDKQLVLQPMLDIIAAGNIRPAVMLSMDLGVSLEEARPYLEKLRKVHSENDYNYADDLIKKWGKF